MVWMPWYTPSISSVQEVCMGKNCNLKDRYQSWQEEGYGKKRIKNVIITVY